LTGRAGVGWHGVGSSVFSVEVGVWFGHVVKPDGVDGVGESDVVGDAASDSVSHHVDEHRVGGELDTDVSAVSHGAFVGVGLVSHGRSDRSSEGRDGR